MLGREINFSNDMTLGPNWYLNFFWDMHFVQKFVPQAIKFDVFQISKKNLVSKLLEDQVCI